MASVLRLNDDLALRTARCRSNLDREGVAVLRFAADRISGMRCLDALFPELIDEIGPHKSEAEADLALVD
jgi:hypothetical protein